MIVCIVLSFLALACLAAGESPAPAPTFNRDIAPIVFAKCVACHHPDGAGPFPLTTYRDVEKRAAQIAKVTGSHYMPPWLPERANFEMEGTRTLTEQEKAAIAAWATAGAPEGEANDLKVKPEWKDGWQNGEPDLVLTMPEPYTLPAEGRDVYRNFVVPARLATDRYVTAFELRPNNSRAVHHAFVLVDRRRSAEVLDRKDAETGFAGMNVGTGVGAPHGVFASWQPGAAPARQPADMSWVLPKGSDLVLQLHMRPTGKEERVSVSIGLYFTERPPSRQPTVILLRSTTMDIPPGDAEYAIENSYTLPVDGDVLSVLPHQHYLGKELRGWAVLPNGAERELLCIKRWDFNWQGAYRYATPVSLPKGTVLHMRYTYDNSAENAQNPNSPPKRVRYGLESSDEMGEFWMQFLPHDPADQKILERDMFAKLALPDKIAHNKAMLDRDPRDVASRTELAIAFYLGGQAAAAEREALQAVKDDPKFARAYYFLGTLYDSQKQLEKARDAYASCVALEPDNGEAQNNFGNLLLREGKAAEAIPHLEKAVKLRPGDPLPQRNLEAARAALKQ